MSFKRTRKTKKIHGLLLLAVFGLAGWVIACTPAVAAPSSVKPQPHTLYLGSWPKDDEEVALIPVDPETLDEKANRRTLEPGFFSADGSTAVDSEYPKGRDVNSLNLNPEEIWIVVRDLQSGVEQSRFHPPTRGLIIGLSHDGTRLLLQPYPFPLAPYPPPVEWYVLDTASGETVAHIEDVDTSCFGQRAHFDPAGLRVYCILDPAVTKADEPEPMQIIMYDVQSGIRTGEVELPDVFIGGKQVERSGQMVEEFSEPAVVLSPNGQRLAVVHADSDKVTLIDTRTFNVKKSFTLNHAASVWGWLVPSRAHAKGEMQGTIRQSAFSPDGRYLYVFSQEIWVKSEDAPAERGLWLVDLEKESIAAEAMPEYQVQWVRPAPDGTVYVFGTTDKRLLPYEIRSTSPSVLWRLDGLTLETLARRELTGYHSGYLIIEDVSSMASDAVASVDAQRECPVTKPPKVPFIPPPPWPAQPPNKDRFWYGEDGLWTALPESGEWRQLALGEKFWWWSEEFDVSEDTIPDLILTAERLDGPAPAFEVSEATNGYHESFNWAMLAGVELASPGCWEFTGHFEGHQLSFVLWVPQE